MKDLEKLSTADLAALLDKTVKTARDAASQKKRIIAEVRRRYGDEIAAALKAKAEPFGTVHVVADGFDTKVEIGKKVEWSDDKLAEMWETITKDGGNPADYINRVITYVIPEARWNGWGENLKQWFQNARTVKEGTVTVEIGRVKE